MNDERMPDELALIRARWAETTPRPWSWQHSHWGSDWIHGPPRQTTIIAKVETGPGDAVAIAHAPADVAYLLAEVERLRAVLCRGCAREYPLDEQGIHQWPGGNELRCVARTVSARQSRIA